VSGETRRVLDFQVEWTTPEGSPDPAARAWGRGRLVVLGETVWGRGEPDDEQPPGVEWTWADLLDHLTDIWPWLVWEQTYPLGLNPSDPTHLRPMAERRWAELASDRVEAEDDELHAWEDRHYLNAGLGGLYVRGVGVVREGLNAVVCVGRTAQRAPFMAVRRDLAAIGDHIAARLRESAVPEARDLVARWENREVIRAERRLLIETGLPAELAPLLPPPGEGEVDTPLRAVARMTRREALDLDQRRVLLEALTGFERAKLTRAFLDLARDAERFIHNPAIEAQRWYDQGLALAAWLRERLGKAGRVDPAALLRKWGVALHAARLPGRFDAVAMWGGDEAAVVVNGNGAHARSLRGRRATWAHELAHLLVDRHGALPVADVLGGSGPRAAEARANAFAAEFLVPRAEIEAYCAEQGITDAETALSRLCARYVASRQLVAHQIRNSHAADDWPPIERQRLEDAGHGAWSE
jgi:hypothetical protein